MMPVQWIDDASPGEAGQEDHEDEGQEEPEVPGEESEGELEELG